ncbi:MAG: hypothetical protein RMI94_10215 [Bryobacterales bacterium]|nr:hypothetical protein [Bryobacteraceae bacterium]MDW8130912.1 hypothetical protein [Bryobacterales bacterium]
MLRVLFTALTIPAAPVQAPSPELLATAVQGAPVLFVLPASRDGAAEAFARWRPATSARNWTLAVLRAELSPSDTTVRLIESVWEGLAQQSRPAAERVYLVGEGAGATAVFYAVSRRPDLWAAAAAIGGNPRLAIETNRLFAANTTLVPVLWLPSAGDPLAEEMRARLASAGYRLADPPKAEMTARELLDWLGEHRSEPFPSRIDCETGEPAFARCYWATMTRLDFSLRNDALPSSRVPPGSGASLALGGFGFDPSAPGPGVLVGWLPENYRGPLKLGDRIVAVGGREIADARGYLEFMERQAEERSAAVMILREGRRIRVETRIVLPRREEVQTARLQAEYLPETRELFVITRGVAALRMNLPAFWTPCRVNWNGTEAGAAEKAGCWQLEEGMPARPCPQ